MSSLAFVAGFVLLLSRASLPVAAQDKEKKAEDDPKEAYQKAVEKARERYARSYETPDSVVDYWARIHYEVDRGTYDTAALHLDGLLKKKPPEEVDAELVKIEEAEGYSKFLVLQGIRVWSDNPQFQAEAKKNVEQLTKRVNDALEKQRNDPARINRFIKGLASPNENERAYSRMQLKRARATAVPLLVDALRNAGGTPLASRIEDALVNGEPDVVPPLLEVLKAHDEKDAQDLDLRLGILNILQQRGDKRTVPYLWHLSASKKYPDLVRNRAKELLAYFLIQPDTERRPELREPLIKLASRLPQAHVALTDLAERYYHHKVRFGGGKGVVLWTWDGSKLQPPPERPYTPREAELFFGLRYAREALELNPGYLPAQLVFLALSLEEAYDGKLDQAEAQKAPPPSVHKLLLTVDPDVLVALLDQGLTDRRLPVILGTIKALAERGEVRAVRNGPNGEPRGLLKAVYYPDRRVQIAAADALLRTPATPASVIAARVVEVLRRFVAAGGTPKVLAAYVPEERVADFRATIKAAGYDAVFVPHARAAMQELRVSSDYDAILIDYAVPPGELPYALAQLRADIDIGLLPLFLFGPPQGEVDRPGVVVVIEKADRVLVKDALDALSEIIANTRCNDLAPIYLTADEARGRQERERARKLAALVGGPTPEERLRSLNRWAERYRNVWVVPELVYRGPEELKAELERDVKQAIGQKLSDEERKLYTRKAMDWLARLARGEVRGYDLRPTLGTLVGAVRKDELAPGAMETLARLPGEVPQQRLAEVVLDEKRAPKLRADAAVQLNRHIQTFGPLLSRDQTRKLTEVFNTAEDAGLRNNVARVVGTLSTSARQTGNRLFQFRPEPPAPPPPAPEKK
jgi:CheY-like chemotaxis protein